MSQLKTNSIVDASGGNTTTINGVAPNVNNIRGKNKIINGDMQVWQRGDNTSGSGYFADRWRIISGLTSAVENLTGSPTGFFRNAYIRRNITGAGVIAQRIEARNSISLSGKTATVKFYHATVSGTVDSIDVELRYATVEDDFTTTTQIQTTNITDVSTGYKEFTFNALPTDVDKGVELRITYNVTGDTYWRLTGVQLEAGDTASGFEHLSYGETLAMCQRYYWQVDDATGYTAEGYIDISTYERLYIKHPVTMRGTPTATGALTNLTSNMRGTDSSNVVPFNADTSRVSFRGAATGRAYAYGGSGDTLTFDAEL